MLIALGAATSPTAAFAQRSAASKARGDAYYFYTGEAYGGAATQQAQILNQYSSAGGPVPPEVVQEHATAIRNNVEGARKAYSHLSDKAKKHTQKGHDKLAESTNSHARHSPSNRKALGDGMPKGGCQPQTVAACCQEIEDELKSVDTKHHDLTKKLKVKTCRRPKLIPTGPALAKHSGNRSRERPPGLLGVGSVRVPPPRPAPSLVAVPAGGTRGTGGHFLELVSKPTGTVPLSESVLKPALAGRRGARCDFAATSDPTSFGTGHFFPFCRKIGPDSSAHSAGLGYASLAGFSRGALPTTHDRLPTPIYVEARFQAQCHRHGRAGRGRLFHPHHARAPIPPPDDPWFRAAVVDCPEPVLVKFGAEWCGPCRRLEPELDRLAGSMRGQVEVVRVDVGRYPQLAQHYRVSSIPRLLLFRQGQIVADRVGFADSHQLERGSPPTRATSGLARRTAP